MLKLARLPDRAVLAVTGPDRVGFLQGLVSNDVSRAGPGRAVFAALLTPQGKYVADFLIGADAGADRLLLDVVAAAADDVAARLKRFRLRAAVDVARTELAVHAGWDGTAPAPGAWPGLVASAPDPRLAALGFRLIVDPAVPGATDQGAVRPSADHVDYDRHRLSLGVPDGGRDMEPDRSVLLEGGYDALDGVSWTKGCYMGQELTARTRYRGLLKRRLVPVVPDVPGPDTLPPFGTPLVAADGADAGAMRSSRDGFGIALVRLAHLRSVLRTPDGFALRSSIPSWMALPADGTDA